MQWLKTITDYYNADYINKQIEEFCKYPDNCKSLDYWPQLVRQIILNIHN